MSDGRVVIDIEANDKQFRKSVSGLGRVASAGVKAAGAAIAVTAAAAATALGVGISKGATRALDIEDAKATLKSLGYEAQQIAVITDSVLASVKGTPYALNDAMSAGVSALAAGVEEGKQLTDYLKTIGDAATVAKVPFNDMAAIFNKVQATGKISGEIIQQLGERGIPILPMLAKAYGVTADELSKMVSRGEVDADTFVKVMRDRFGGAALDAGETTRGAIGNAQAAIGRLGASLVNELLPNVKEGLGGLIGEIDALGPAFAMIGSGLAEMLSGDDVVSSRLEAMAGDVKVGSEKVTAGLTEFVGKLSDGIGQLAPMVIDVLVALIIAVAEALPELVTSLVPPLLDGILALAAAVPGIIPPLLTALVGALAIVFSGLMSALPPLVTDLVAALVAALPILIEGAAMLLVGIAEALPIVLPQIVQALTDGINTIALMLPTLLPILIEAGIALFTGLIQASAVMAPQLTAAFVELITVLVDMLPTLMPMLTDASLQLFLALVVAMAQSSPQIMASLSTLMIALIRLIPKFAGSLIETAFALFSSMAKAPDKAKPVLSKAMNTLLQSARDVVPKFAADFQKAGKEIVDGIIAGVGEKVAALKDAVVKAAKAALEAAKKFLDVNSPSKLFKREVGLSIMEGWEAGISDNIAPVVGAVINAANSIVGAATDSRIAKALAMAPAVTTVPSAFTPHIPSTSLASGSASMPGSFDRSVNVTFNTPVVSYADTVRGVRDASRAIARR